MLEILLTSGGVSLFLSLVYLMFWISYFKIRDAERKVRNEKRPHLDKKAEQDIEDLSIEFQLPNPTVEKFEALMKQTLREQEVDSLEESFKKLYKSDISTAPEPDSQSYDVINGYGRMIVQYTYPPISGGRA